MLSAPASIFAAEIKNELKRHTMFNGEKKQIIQSKRLADALFILWAGGAALLSYSLVYALRKPFTAAGFDGLDFFGMDYKTATSIVQISGYFISKLIGIKVISELKKENRQRAFVGMHVGSDFQFPRGAAGDGPAGEPNGAEHCHQFGHGKVRRAVCDGASPHQ